MGTSLGGLGIHVAALAKAPIRRIVINDIGPFLPWNALRRLGVYLTAMPKSFAHFHAAEAYFREILAPFGRLGDAEWFHLTKHSIARTPEGRSAAGRSRHRQGLPARDVLQCEHVAAMGMDSLPVLVIRKRRRADLWRFVGPL